MHHPYSLPITKCFWRMEDMEVNFRLIMFSLNLFITTPLRYLPIPWQFFCKIRLSRPVWERQNVLATILSLLLWPKNYRLGRTGLTGEPRKTYFSQYKWYLFSLQVSMSRDICTLLLSCNTKLPQVLKSQNSSPLSSSALSIFSFL